jgi:hypothetical protein
MKKLIAAIVSLAGMPLAAQAASTQMDILVSKDGTNWSSSVTVDQFGGESGRVYVAYTISYVAASGDAIPDAFASVTFQPVFSNVRDTDTVAAFVNRGNNTNGGAIDPRASYGDGTGAYGRLKPWAATGPSTSQSYVTFSHTTGQGGAPAGSYTRIARNDVTNWMGVGATSGTASVNNFIGAGGVVIGQKQNPTAGVDPTRVAGNTNLLVMVLCIQTGMVGMGDTWDLTATAPLTGFTRNSTTGGREATWYANTTENSGSIKAAVVVHDATIHMVPGPGCVVVLASSAFGLRRRRLIPATRVSGGGR